VAELVVDEMGIRSKLIESVCERIVNRIFSLSKNIDWVEVKVCKINPPIDGDVQNVSVVIKKER
jgi:dihydroneopterin aldolase